MSDFEHSMRISTKPRAVLKYTPAIDDESFTVDPVLSVMSYFYKAAFADIDSPAVLTPIVIDLSLVVISVFE